MTDKFFEVFPSLTHERIQTVSYLRGSVKHADEEFPPNHVMAYNVILKQCRLMLSINGSSFVTARDATLSDVTVPHNGTINMFVNYIMLHACFLIQ